MSEQTTTPESADDIFKINLSDRGRESQHCLRATSVDIWAEYWMRGSQNDAIRHAPVSEVHRFSRFGKGKKLRSEADRQMQALLWLYDQACFQCSLDGQPIGDDRRSEVSARTKKIVMAIFMELVFGQIQPLPGKEGPAAEAALSA